MSETAPPPAPKTAEPLSPSPGSEGVCLPCPQLTLPLTGLASQFFSTTCPPDPDLDHQPSLMGPAGTFNSFQERLGWKQMEGLENRRGPIG